MAPRSSSIGLSRGDLDTLRRVHIVDPVKWGLCAGTDFWLMAAANGALTATGNNLLTDGGWTATSMAVADGSAADLLSKADVGVPGEFTTNAAADLLKSPAIFGDYAHSHAAAVIMGKNSLPRFLVADMYARLSTASADEQTTNLGFVEDGGSIVTAADSAVAINTDSTNWRVEVNGARLTNTNNVAVSATYHWFRIVADKQAQSGAGGVYAYIDGVLIASGAIASDESPWAWGFGNGTTNRWQLNQAHLFYAWQLPRDQQDF